MTNVIPYKLSWTMPSSRRGVHPPADTLICPENFYLKPEDVPGDDDMRDTFLRQFKPCGYYQTHCSHKFNDWFPDMNELTPERIIRANVDYPGGGIDNEIKNGISLVEFDIGLDDATYQRYQEEAAGTTYDHDSNMLDNIEGDPQRYLDINNCLGQTNEPLWTSSLRPFETGEHCVGTFAQLDDDWDTNYMSMGTCGAGHSGYGYAMDCMKHDVCSYFDFVAVGFCRDFDCGDEAAQTVLNCGYDNWDPLPNSQMICQEDLHQNSQTIGGYFSALSPSLRFAIGQKEECTLRTGYDINQGMPYQRYVPGTTCTANDDCISNSCSSVWGCLD